MSKDHKRLQARLEWAGFSEVKIKSDGNCQFRSLADQLFKSSDFHEKVRETIVKQLKSCPRSYKELVEIDSSRNRTKNVPKDFSEYVKNMSKNGVWGDNVTLKAAADAFGVKILLITSYKDISSIEILPKSQKSQRVIYLSYLAGVHYNSIYLNTGSDTDTASMELQRAKDKQKDEEEDKEEDKDNQVKKKNNNNKKKKKK